MSGHASPRNERGIVKLLIVAVVGALAVGAFGIYWYVIRDTAPDKATTVNRPTVAPESGPDGTYTVQSGDDTFAGFRIAEHFGPLDHTAVMRSPAVTGTMTLAGSNITATEITVDLTAIESKDDQPPGVPSVGNRVRNIQNDGLEIAKFPEATFALSGPVALPNAPEVGQEVKVAAAGKLTIHGVTNDVTIPITARWNGEVIDASGSLDVVLADYGMTAPSRAFVTVDGTGTLEFQISLAK